MEGEEKEGEKSVFDQASFKSWVGAAFGCLVSV